MGGGWEGTLYTPWGQRCSSRIRLSLGTLAETYRLSSSIVCQVEYCVTVCGLINTKVINYAFLQLYMHAFSCQG